MIELTAKSPCAGLLPLDIGTVTLTEAGPERMTSLAPFRGREAALATVLKQAHGVNWPAPNRATGRDGVRMLWFGQRMALLIGPAPDAALAAEAALSDQSDAWAVVTLAGPGARDVLARLTPLDLRPNRFKRGHTARTDLRHMMASVTRLGPDRYRVMVFRGFAETLVHDLRAAMERVAAR